MRPFQHATDIVRVKNAYRALQETTHGQIVLRDLAKTCKAASSSFDKDPHQHSYNAGKRSIWLRIQNMINIPDREVYEMENKNE